MTSFRSFSTKNDSFKNLHGLHGMWVFDPPVHARCARRETASFFDRYTPEIQFFCIGSSRDDVQCIVNRFGPRGHANWWQIRSNGRKTQIPVHLVHASARPVHCTDCTVAPRLVWFDQNARVTLILPRTEPSKSQKGSPKKFDVIPFVFNEERQFQKSARIARNVGV